ncbi:MAG TPA: glycosyltransferase family 39 protein [Terriglobales bacterium]|nr:glycosyltransferase family 39 protein [Terriglobales bacterium]
MSATATFEPAVHTGSSSRFIPYALLAVILFATCVVRVHLRNIPLERDEGEYAYAGQLMLQGIPPYKLAYNMKLPGTYAAYAAILAIFGQSAAGVHLGLLIVNLATIVLIFLLGRRLSGSIAAVVAAASYAILSVSPSVLGFAGHATHFVVLAALAGILVLLEAIDADRVGLTFVSGILLGLAFVMKQPGFLFVIFGGLCLLAGQRGERVSWMGFIRKLGAFSAGAAVPFAITCLALWWAGVFGTFWFWTVSYASQYASNWGIVEGARLFANAFPRIVGSSIGIWLIAAVGFSAAVWDRQTRSHRLFLTGFLLFSFLAVCPGLLFREHYFILLLPAVSLLTGIGVSATKTWLSALRKGPALVYLPAALFVIGLAASFYAQKAFFLANDFYALSRRIYGGNPFPEAEVISKYIREHTPENSRIAVLGSEPEIYFYSHRHSATGYIYTYGLMEEQKYALEMQNQMINEIESARPDALVFVNVAASWLPMARSQTLIYSWAQKYIREQYELTGIAEIHMSYTDYRWGEEAKNYQPRSNSVVFVFKRKNS